MAKFAATAQRLKAVLVPPSSQPALDVALWFTAARTASGLTGRLTTSSTASQKLIGHRNLKTLRGLAWNQQLMISSWEQSAPYVWRS